MTTKYYAVKAGRKPGVYMSWDECQKQIDGYSGAAFKKFYTLEEAKKFVGKATEKMTSNRSKKKSSVNDLDEPYAFVDGSFVVLDDGTPVYGFGGFVQYKGKPHYFKGCGTDPNLVGMRNVAGEIIAAMTAVKIVKGLESKQLMIIYDYAGIEAWATQTWKANQPGTQFYQLFMFDAMLNGMDIQFVKVKGHTGVEGNEIADALAKSAVGLPVEPKYESIVKQAKIIEASE